MNRRVPLELAIISVVLGGLACQRSATEPARTSREQRPFSTSVAVASGRVSAPKESAVTVGGRNGHISVPDAGAAVSRALTGNEGAAVAGETTRQPDATSTPAPSSRAVAEAPAAPLDNVTVTIQTEPPLKAFVQWGAKDLGATPLEVKRPRASGPLDLVIRAQGYLTVHTRAFTDHNDRLVVRLIPETEAPHVLGYRSTELTRPKPKPFPHLGD